MQGIVISGSFLSINCDLIQPKYVESVKKLFYKMRDQLNTPRGSELFYCHIVSLMKNGDYDKNVIIEEGRSNFGFNDVFIYPDDGIYDENAPLAHPLHQETSTKIQSNGFSAVSDGDSVTITTPEGTEIFIQGFLPGATCSITGNDNHIHFHLNDGKHHPVPRTTSVKIKSNGGNNVVFNHGSMTFVTPKGTKIFVQGLTSNVTQSIVGNGNHVTFNR